MSYYSVGRVQSPAVRIVVEREREIRCFKSVQIIEVNLFEKKPISFMVAEALKRNPEPPSCDQLILFEN